MRWIDEIASKPPAPAPCRAATIIAAPRIGRIVNTPGHRDSGKGERMQPATSVQPRTAIITAIIGVSNHEALAGFLAEFLAGLSDRRCNSAMAINPPANGSQALAGKAKKDEPVASFWLSHKHHASDSAATT